MGTPTHNYLYDYRRDSITDLSLILFCRSRISIGFKMKNSATRSSMSTSWIPFRELGIFTVSVKRFVHRNLARIMMILVG